MGLRSLIGVLIMGLAFAFVGCDSDKAQKIQPETRGKRNELCQARNDCEEGLACLNGVCSKNNFGLATTPRQCDRIDCAKDTDCCGDKPMKAPAKCNKRETVCTPQLPGCVNNGSICTSDATCTGGVCGMGTCSSLGTTCETSADCVDTCNPATLACRFSFATCTVATEEIDCPTTTTCSTRFCSCANPDYDPTDPICSDEDCDPEAVCTLSCQDERCIQDNSCEADEDCPLGASHCEDGRCVQCLEDEDCNEEAGETCTSDNTCHKPCEVNEECGLFEECQEDGTCLYVGCQVDNDCILATNRFNGDGTGGTPALAVSGGDDPRLYKCRESDSAESKEKGIKECLIPCENDGTCGTFQACTGGYCKFIGCANDEQCRTYLGITDQRTTPEKPYVSKAVCRE